MMSHITYESLPYTLRYVIDIHRYIVMDMYVTYVVIDMSMTV